MKSSPSGRSNLSKIISLPSSSSNYILDDQNLTKSWRMSSLKQKATRCVNQDLQNLTKNVIDQKDSNLCVPISVASLIRHAIKHDLNFESKYLTLEYIFVTITMVVYPRSMAGLNINPKEEETQFQTNDVETLLKRVCQKTYLMRSGWEIIKSLGPDETFRPKESICSFEKGKYKKDANSEIEIQIDILLF